MSSRLRGSRPARRGSGQRSTPGKAKAVSVDAAGRRYWPLARAVLLANASALLLFVLRVLLTGLVRYRYLPWNLLLAWLPLVTAWLLRGWRWRGRRWAELGLPVVWLLLLPNSFYVVSDLIHLRAVPEIGLLYDAVLFAAFIINSFGAGLAALYFMHRWLIDRLGGLAHGLMAGACLLSGFAIYLGRSQRWNSWDAALNPAGLLFDVSERLINPLAHPQLIVTTASFFLLIGSLYLVVWRLMTVRRA